MKEKIKKYWKEGLIILLVMFGMNKCTQSCTRGTRADKAEFKVDSLMKVCDGLKNDTARYIEKIRLYEDFDFKRDLQDSIHNADIKAQKAQTDELIRQNRALINKRKR